MALVHLRYFNVFGPRQNPSGPYAAVIPRFIQAILKNEPPEIHGDGLQARDFTYVDNVVHANWLALARPLKPGSHVVNIACGATTSVLDLWHHLQALAGTSLHPVHTEPQAGDIRHSRTSIGRARRLLGYEVTVPLDEGLRHTVEWFHTRQI